MQGKENNFIITTVIDMKFGTNAALFVSYEEMNMKHCLAKGQDL